MCGVRYYTAKELSGFQDFKWQKCHHVLYRFSLINFFLSIGTSFEMAFDVYVFKWREESSFRLDRKYLYSLGWPKCALTIQILVLNMGWDKCVCCRNRGVVLGVIWCVRGLMGCGRRGIWGFCRVQWMKSWIFLREREFIIGVQLFWNLRLFWCWAVSPFIKFRFGTDHSHLFVNY